MSGITSRGTRRKLGTPHTGAPTDPTVPDPGEIVGFLDPELLPAAVHPEPGASDRPAAVEPDPDPVRVSEVGAARWRSTRHDLAADIPAMVATHMPGRKTVQVVNRHATETAYIGPRRDVETGSGFPVPAGESITIGSIGEVWAIAAAASIVYALETMAP